MLYFETRSKARSFANGKYKVIDMCKRTNNLVDVFKAAANIGTKRWAVKVL